MATKKEKTNNNSLSDKVIKQAKKLASHTKQIVYWAEEAKKLEGNPNTQEMYACYEALALELLDLQEDMANCSDITFKATAELTGYDMLIPRINDNY